MPLPHDIISIITIVIIVSIIAIEGIFNYINHFIEIRKLNTSIYNYKYNYSYICG